MNCFFHIFLSRAATQNSYIRDCVAWIDQNIKGNFPYKIYFSDKRLNLKDFNANLKPANTNIIMWDSMLVKENFEITELGDVNVIFLKHKTEIFKNTKSKNEAVDENFLLFNGFKCVYLNPDKNETNYQYDTIISEDKYIFDLSKYTNIKARTSERCE